MVDRLIDVGILRAMQVTRTAIYEPLMSPTLFVSGAISVEFSCADFHRAAPPVSVDSEEDVAEMMNRLTSLRLSRIALPEVSSEAL